MIDAGRPQVGDVALLEEDDPVGVGEDRGDVAREEALPSREADDERHVLPGADEPVGLAPMHDDDARRRPRAGARRGPDGVGEVALRRPPR